MKVFVTGGAGYIGSICVEQLLDAGHDVVVFDNLSEGHRSAVDERAMFIEGCLSDRETILNAVGSNQPEAIMHFAANALVGESMANPSKYFRNNVANGINLLEAAVEGGVRKFVFSSTCATFGVPETMPMTEALPQNPINPYGESKLIFEKNERISVTHKSILILVIIFIIFIFLEFFSVNFDFPSYRLDHFHDGNYLTPVQNYISTKKLWTSSYIERGLSVLAFSTIGKIF